MSELPIGGLAFLSISAFFITWMFNNIHEINKNKTNQRIGGRSFVIFIFSIIATIGLVALFGMTSYDKTWKLLSCMFLTVAFSVVTGFCLSKWLFYKDSMDSKEKQSAINYLRFGFIPGIFLSILFFGLSNYYIGNVRQIITGM